MAVMVIVIIIVTMVVITKGTAITIIAGGDIAIAVGMQQPIVVALYVTT